MDATKKQSWLFGGAGVSLLGGIVLAGIAYDADPVKWGMFGLGIVFVIAAAIMAYKGNKL